MTDEKTQDTKTALDRARESVEKAKAKADEAAKRARLARAKLKRMEEKRNKPDRRADFRRKVILGAVVLKEFPNLVPGIVEKMPEAVRKAYLDATAKAQPTSEPLIPK